MIEVIKQGKPRSHRRLATSDEMNNYIDSFIEKTIIAVIKISIILLVITTITFVAVILSIAIKALTSE
jgi:hypothetical protein